MDRVVVRLFFYQTHFVGKKNMVIKCKMNKQKILTYKTMYTSITAIGDMR